MPEMPEPAKLTYGRGSFMLINTAESGSDPMKCRTCGFDNPLGLAYCGNCGARLAARPDVPPSPTQTLGRPTESLGRGSLLGGRFEVLEELGGGGMGMVYRVLDRKINEDVALKVLKPEVASDAGTIERFKNELKIARRITHKNVCRMYDLHDEAGTVFITMEYVPGEDLKSLIRRAGRLSVAKAVAVAKEIVDGLAEAHRLGVVHRDLKPQNIMIDRDGGAKIMDFGIARQASGPELTAAGVMMGTPTYMSPEQAAGEAVDSRADIYAFGAILYEMVVGRPPFEGESALGVALKHRTVPPVPPRQSNPQIPEELDRLILRCLAKRMDDRYQNAEELSAALVRIGQEISGGTPVLTVMEGAGLTAPERESIHSVAVLPFQDMSPQHDQDYFCEGLAEELINALTQVKGLKVAARTSSFSFKGKTDDIREIGRRLDVASILEGSVRKAGNHLRVTTQLICVSDGYHLWSERFDRTADNIFAVQDEISLAVVKKLRVELLEGEKEKITRRHTQDKDAHSLYLKGRYHWNRRSPKDMIEAVDCFQRAIDRDPAYALPYVGMADVFNMLAEFGFIPPRDGYLKSREWLKRAREIDDSLSDLYYSLSLITYCYEWDLPAAERLVRRSIELNPRNAFAHASRAEILGTSGRTEEALEEAKTALELDPLSPLMPALYGLILGILGREEEGREKMHEAMVIEPDNPMLNAWLGMIYLLRPAVPEKAVEYLQKAADLGAAFAYGYMGLAQGMAGRGEEALRCLAKLEKIEKEPFVPFVLKPVFHLKPGLRHFRTIKKKYVPAYFKALVYVGLNRREDALVQFEKSSEARDYLVPVTLEVLGLMDLPWVAEFTSLPRFQALRAKIKRC
jgi:serine/threonine protein kinase/tetratricopeptide (TPR) repeat protein